MRGRGKIPISLRLETISRFRDAAAGPAADRPLARNSLYAIVRVCEMQRL
ncbi:hypothetical protein PATSB16_20370 [Pandoraea thiooxydans]|nr:hypothetical protein PATSB16_20370 [Pandoraea thiooxydans]